MCGIAGILDLKGRPIDPDSDTVGAMTTRLAHRGPNGMGTYANGPIALGHTRLAVIDVEGGAQPMFNEDRSIALVFNGEIYNFQEIRDALLKKGHVFTTRSDTEVIIRLYESEGMDCVKRLRGMFAFALWDARRKKLHVARDIAGKKPLYYTREHNRFFFASEIKALSAAGLRPPLNLPALALFFKYQFIPGPETIFQNIRALPPAHLMTVDEKGTDIKPYWTLPPPEASGSSEADYREILREKLEEAVKRRLVSDVPLGAFLSGGLDSSIIVGLMRRRGAEDLKTFSIGFSEDSFDETPFAKRVATIFNTDHHHETLRLNLRLVLPEIIAQFDQPFGDASSVAVHQLSKMTRRSVTVALSGDGSDEIFGGYRRYVARKLLGYYQQLPRFFRKQCVERLSDALPEGSAYYADSFVKQLRLFVHFSKRLEADPNNILPQAFTGDEQMRLFRPETQAQLKMEDQDAIQTLAERFSSLDAVTQMLRTDFNSYLPDDILVKADRMSMAHGLEVRCPFLDQEVIEAAFRMPVDLKLKGLQTKYILKKTFQDLLPREITQRKKHGFMLPLGSLFKKELKPYIEEILLKPDRLGLLNTAYIAHLNREHQDGFRDHSVKLWLLLVYRLWEMGADSHV
ncbi:MAG: asparagine synthase (glutamine-hydrolyzing) [Nitrospiria bacterium]